MGEQSNGCEEPGTVGCDDLASAVFGDSDPHPVRDAFGVGRLRCRWCPLPGSEGYVDSFTRTRSRFRGSSCESGEFVSGGLFGWLKFGGVSDATHLKFGEDGQILAHGINAMFGSEAGEGAT